MRTVQRKANKTVSISDLVSVLHDAKLWGFSVVLKERRAYFTATCLRLDQDGSVPEDQRVICHFTGLGAVAIAYESDVFTKPSEKGATEHFSLVGTDLPFDIGGEVRTASGSTLASMLADPSTHWLAGTGGRIKGRKLIAFDVQRGQLSGTVLLWFRSFEAKVYTSLPMKEWIRQNSAWWKAWRRYHDGKSGPKPIDPQMDAAIPLGSCDEPTQPCPAPSDKVELAEAPGVPAWLATAANAWASEEHRVGRRSGWHRGSRPYLREVLDWWVEGKHAAIRMRGIEHDAWSDEQDKAAHDTVFELRFVRVAKHWCVSRRKSSLSRFFRPRLISKPAWHKDWRGTIND